MPPPDEPAISVGQRVAKISGDYRFAGGAFWRATDSKSNTLIASFGVLICSPLAGAQIIGSGSLDGASMPKADIAPDANSGFPAKY